MYKYINKIKGISVKTIDSHVGFARELYFDMRDLTLRYILIDTEDWLADRKVLISPDSITNLNWDQEEIVINYQRAEVEQSPMIRLDEPVTRDKEKMVRDYYNLPPYWGNEKFDEKMSFLVNYDELKSMDVKLIDGEMGKTSDAIIEDDNWKIKFIIVDANSIDLGRRIPVPTEWVNSLDNEKKELLIDLKKESFEDAPEFPIEEFEDERNIKTLYDFYNRPRYW
ncbi:MAG: hypothetical protein GF307_00410 [candidate division Zixibacteria bacterium]|nr:hypothetical protein [candidate division Zixibacteria bacterium]